MSLYLDIFNVLFLRSWTKILRRPVHLTFSLVQPLMWMLFFGFLFHRYSLDSLPANISYLDFLAPGVCVMTILFGASQSGIELIRDMQSRFLMRLLDAPVHPMMILIGKLSADVVRLMLQAAVVLLLALLLGAQLNIDSSALWIMLSGMFAFAFALCSLSCLIALLAKSQESMATFVHMVNMPLFFTSTALVPGRQMPEWLAAIADVNPLSLVVNANRAALLGFGSDTMLYSLMPVMVLAVLLFASCVFIFTRFRMEN